MRTLLKPKPSHIPRFARSFTACAPSIQLKPALTREFSPSSLQNMVWIYHRCTTLFLLLHSIVVVGSIRPRSTSFVGSIRPRSTSLLETEMYAGIRGACTSNTKWPPKDPKSDKTDQVPMQAMCGYCQNAVYSVAMGGGAGTGCTTATDNGMEACEKLAKEVDGKASAIKKFYEEKIEELGPGGGWSMEFCLDMSCCKMK